MELIDEGVDSLEYEVKVPVGNNADDQFHQFFLEMKLAQGDNWKINNTPDYFA